MNSLRLTILALAAAPLLLAGCGKKPDFPLPPQGREADTFPRRYPDPGLDPQPGARTAPQPSNIVGGPAGTPKPEAMPKPVTTTPETAPSVPAGTNSPGTP